MCSAVLTYFSVYTNKREFVYGSVFEISGSKQQICCLKSSFAASLKILQQKLAAWLFSH